MINEKNLREKIKILEEEKDNLIYRINFLEKRILDYEETEIQDDNITRFFKGLR